MPLGVQVKGIEFPNPFHHLLIMFCHELGVLVLCVYRVAGVVSDHRQPLGREIIFHHVVQVFIMPPGKVHLV